MTGRATTRPTPAEERLFSRKYAAATFSFAAVMFLTGFAALAVVPMLPVAARDLDGVPLYPLVAGCFVAASLFGGVLGGDWADRAGAGRPLAAGVVLAVVTLVVSATSTSIWQLAVGRFLDGVAAGMIAVAINTAIAHAYPDRLRAKALALMSTCWIIPSLTGPPLAGLVAAWWSWRVVFFGLAALTVIPSLVVVVMLRSPSWQAPSKPASDAVENRTPRPALMVAAAVSVGAALGQYAVSGWDLRHLLCGAAGLALLVVFVPRLLPPGTWRAARGLPAAVLLRGLTSGAYFTLEAFVPLLLTTARRVPPVQTGLAFTGAAIAWAGSSWLQGRLQGRVSRHGLVTAGALVMGAAVAVAAVGTLPALPALTAAGAMVLAAVGMGMAAPSLTLLSLTHSPSGRQGYASSAMQTSQNLGQMAVMGVASAVFNLFLGFGSAELPGYAAAFGLLLVPSVLAASLAVRARST
ncbi:MFS transporter [Streptomyces sp. NBC_01022]|uniref:MFS transporter n=1 Tax=Streptomyces sp. NBC_01022 TaxID=2903723 RepID=UPI002DDAE14E|nr:MFS transporter [Streptomyces sp. NBC_01022]WRZ87208.1 MFS transporter [Streptomyces sp. NBC_01022]